ncbi:MAG TPA: hypothetical protein VHW66_15305 [Stellaceae bacterium]|jgi:hypothetical protein|nr:hypothetical protein [Stellaceae bacterium]
MSPRTLLFGAAAALALTLSAGSSYAFSEVEIIKMHDACRAGDRMACTHRDAAIHDHAHEAEWRHSHPEWYR